MAFSVSAAAAGASLASFDSGAAAPLSPLGSASEDVQSVWRRHLEFILLAMRDWEPYQVVSQELHDQGRILVALFTQCIQLYEGVRNFPGSRKRTCTYQRWHHRKPAWQGDTLDPESSRSRSKIRRSSKQGRDGWDVWAVGRWLRPLLPLCMLPMTYRPRSYACRQWRTRQGNGGSHPSYGQRIRKQ